MPSFSSWNTATLRLYRPHYASPHTGRSRKMPSTISLSFSLLYSLLEERIIAQVSYREFCAPRDRYPCVTRSLLLFLSFFLFRRYLIPYITSRIVRERPLARRTSRGEKFIDNLTHRRDVVYYDDGVLSSRERDIPVRDRGNETPVSV